MQLTRAISIPSKDLKSTADTVAGYFRDVYDSVNKGNTNSALGLVIKPSGDTSGITDLANIQEAIAALPPRGGEIILSNSADWYLPTTGGIEIGDGDGSTMSTKNGIKLIGMGGGGAGLGTDPDLAAGGIKIHSLYNGPAIKVNGPISGWGIENIFIKVEATGTAARGISTFHANSGDSKNLAVSINNPSQGCFEEINGFHNNWYNIWPIIGGDATSAFGIKITGSGDSNTCFDNWYNLTLWKSDESQIGLWFGNSDNNRFFGIHSMGGGKAVVYDYSDPAHKPGDNQIFGLCINDTESIENIGTPPADAVPNRIFGFGLCNGAEDPELDNLIIMDTPSIKDETGGWELKVKSITEEITASTDIPIYFSIPKGSRIEAIQMRVESALNTGETWDAGIDDGGGGALYYFAINEPVAQNTKINVADPFNTNDTAGVLSRNASCVSPTILGTYGDGHIYLQRHSNPGVDSFTAQGAVTGVIYYWQLKTMGDAP